MPPELWQKPKRKVPGKLRWTPVKLWRELPKAAKWMWWKCMKHMIRTQSVLFITLYLIFQWVFFSWICCLEKQNIDNKNCQENGEMAKCCKVVSWHHLEYTMWPYFVTESSKMGNSCPFAGHPHAGFLFCCTWEGLASTCRPLLVFPKSLSAFVLFCFVFRKSEINLQWELDKMK